MTPTDAARTRTSRPAHANARLVGRGLVPAAVLAGTLGATTLAGASTPQPVVTTAKIAGLGTVLVASHRPLYELASDPKGHTTCTGACTKIWIPLIVSHKAAHHLGHVSGLGTIHRSNKLQVAMHGHALYFFAADHSQSSAGGQGFANIWFTVKANGSLNRTTSAGTSVTAPPASTAGSSSPSSTTTQPTSAPPHNPGTPMTTNPAPATPAPTSPPPTSPPTTSPPPPPPTTSPPPPPPTTTTTTSGGGGGVGF